ncbi:MAG TPA: RNA methyltransferase, partial [Eubacteriaceae bacterium]|nr:RNA methyltransferase [Eubacteriaceae bacterium]
MKPLKIIATTTFGLEGILKNEIKSLGWEVEEVDTGRVSFYGDLNRLAQAN